MKTPTDDHELIRWIDGEMTETERALFEERLKQEPELNCEARKMRAFSDTLRAHMPAEMRVPHADYFNTQIEVRITQMALDDARALQSASPLGALLQWFRQPWFALAGAAALGVAAFVLMNPVSGDDTVSMILSSYTPNTKVQARTYHDRSADATVLMLDGLDSMPSDRKISGVNIQRGELEPELASTTMYDDKGAAVLMISSDALGNPQISPEG